MGSRGLGAPFSKDTRAWSMWTVLFSNLGSKKICEFEASTGRTGFEAKPVRTDGGIKVKLSSGFGFPCLSLCFLRLWFVIGSGALVMLWVAILWCCLCSLFRLSRVLGLGCAGFSSWRP